MPVLAVDLSSPDGNYRVEIGVVGEGRNSALTYAVWYKGRQIILPSGIRLDLKRPSEMFENLAIFQVDTMTHESEWTPLYGERSRIPDQFNGIVVWVRNGLDTTRYFQLVCRAYNQGVAFRIQFPELRTTQIVDIADEKMEFVFPQGTYAFFSSRPQAAYDLRPMTGSWTAAAEKPLTMILPDSTWVSILEGDFMNYSSMKLELIRNRPGALVTTLFGPVTETSPFATPWRAIMAGENPGELLENNFLTLNLCQASTGDWSWVKPGKVIRMMDYTIPGAKSYIDFAAKHHIQYVLIDAGWYGEERAAASKIVAHENGDFKNKDIPSILKYAKKKKIGVWLYVNHRQLEEDADAIFALFRKHGVAGVKFGFVHTGSHRWTVWLTEAIKKAGRYGLMVDVHDEYRPTGVSRTFPNLLTQEGVLGNEAMPDATHNTMLPFTRMLAGAADYTFCYYLRPELVGSERRSLQTTPVHQLALPVIYYSPLQHLFWYDRPQDYQGEPELEFWERLPVTWDDTRVLSGTPGRSAVVARRRGNDWFIGAITNTDSASLSIPMDFLVAGSRYEAVIYFDDPTNTSTRTKVSQRVVEVDSQTVLHEKVLPSGGVAIHIRPTTISESRDDGSIETP